MNTQAASTETWGLGEMPQALPLPTGSVSARYMPANCTLTNYLYDTNIRMRTTGTYIAFETSYVAITQSQ